MKKLLCVFTLLIASVFVLTSCESKEYKLLINDIDNIDVITINDKGILDSLLERYNNLSSEDKAKVSNIDVVTSGLEHIENLIIVDEIINLISSINKPVSILDKESLDYITNKVNGLDKSYQQLITNIDLLHEYALTVDELIETKQNTELASLFDLEVIELIKSTNYTSELLDSVVNSLTKYDLLPSEVKQYVTKYNDLLKYKEVVKYSLDSYSVVSIIDSLPSVLEVSISDEDKVLQVKAQYNNLPSKYKDLVTNIDKVSELLNKIASLKQIEEDKVKANLVIVLINNLVEPTISTNEFDNDKVKYGSIMFTLEEYNNLTVEQKKYVSNHDTLTNFLNMLNDVNLTIEYMNEAKVIDNLIMSIPSLNDITLNDYESITNIYNEFIKLDNNILKYVTLTKKLTDSKNLVDKLLKEDNMKKEINNFYQLVDLIPLVNDLVLSDETKVNNAQNLYNSLSKEVKNLVDITYVNKLNESCDRIDYLKKYELYKNDIERLYMLIDSLDLNNITLNDETVINEALSINDSLSKDAKEFIDSSQIDKLLTATILLNKIKEDNKDKAYIVKFYLDNGYLAGSKKEEIVNQKFNEFVINHYNSGFWANYKTDVVCYKASSISPEDSYTFNLKVGFNKNNDGTYTVDSIVNDGTALTNKTSEYYLIANNAYSLGYGYLSSMKIGDILYVNGVLDDEASSTKNITVKTLISSEVAYSAYYTLTFYGNMVLPTPTKVGYDFLGYYDNSSFTGEAVTSVTGETTLYALYKKSEKVITELTILDSISDLVSSDTIDNLPSSLNGYSYVYTSSNPSLYYISNGIGKTIKSNQTHKKQTVTVSVMITTPSNETIVQSKEITINPVLFEDLPNTVVATYFSTGAMSAYKTYSERYKKTNEIFSSNAINTLNIVYYAFITIDSTGNVQLANSSYINDVMKLKNNDIRIVGSINGVSTESCRAFMSLTQDNTKRAKFVKNLMDLVEQYNLDGLDIDWESVSSTDRVYADRMNMLCKDLKDEMNKRQDEGGSSYLLTAAVPASSWGADSNRFDFKTLNNYLDFINIMSYDMHKTDITTHLSPLHKSKKDGGWGFGGVYGVELMSSSGFDKSKLIIGSAGYGKAYKVTGQVTSSNNGLGVSGTLIKIDGIPGSFNSGTLYGSAISMLIKTGKYTNYDQIDNGNFVGSYLYNPTDKIFVTYDSPKAFVEKYKYASINKCGGVMNWCYSEDTDDLYINSIYEYLNK